MRPHFVACIVLLTSAAVHAQVPPPRVVDAERASAGGDVLLPLARSAERGTAIAAIGAIGRLQDRSMVQPLLDIEASTIPEIREAAASALAQTLVTADPRADRDLTGGVADRLLEHGQWRAVSRIALPDAARASRVEALLDDVLRRTASVDGNISERLDATSAFESLARRNARLAGFSLHPDSVQLLESIVLNGHANDSPARVRRYALWTLVQSRTAAAPALRAALVDRDDQTRRLAVQFLAGNGAALPDDERATALTAALKDPSIIVRVEAVRSFAKHATSAGGCGSLMDELRDEAPHVVNVALDALGTACPGDAAVTNRVAAEAMAPTGTGWQRQAHALVALAARDGARAGTVLPAFAAHPVWEVRMYAARAAASMKDEAMLSRLAMDASDNVRSAALPALYAISPERAQSVLIAALGRSDYQLLRTAATLLKDAPPSRTMSTALVEALRRVTAEQKQTSRDARLPLLDAIAVHGNVDDAKHLESLLTDIDPQVAARAAAVLNKWGRTVTPATSTAPADVTPAFTDSSTCVAVEMANGRRMRLQPDPSAAPVTSGWFLTLALDRHFYDGFTFHRVEPNFVIQGGSPGANEYSSGLARFRRDEVGLPNVRGAVGLSTRGLNTADGQIYILHVDEPRLDGRYTIFAHVFDDAEDMRTLDGIQEGDRIRRVAPTACMASPR